MNEIISFKTGDGEESYTLYRCEDEPHSGCYHVFYHNKYPYGCSGHETSWQNVPSEINIFLRKLVDHFIDKNR